MIKKIVLPIIFGSLLAVNFIPVSSFKAAHAAGHVHCDCCASTAGDDFHVHNVEHEWIGTSALPTTAGYYYLTSDVVISKTYKPVDGVHLCLNGYTINGNKECNVIEIESNKTFSLTDCQETLGKITGGVPIRTSSSGSYYCGGGVINYGTFNMFNGHITENTVNHPGAGSYGSGICNFKTGTFNMFNGKITKNYAWGYTGGSAIRTEGITRIFGGEISDNYAQFNNAAIDFVGGTLELHGSPVIINNGDPENGISVGNNPIDLIDFVGSTENPIVINAPYKNVAVISGGEIPENISNKILPFSSDGRLKYAIKDNVICFTCSHHHLDGALVADYQYSVSNNQLLWNCTNPKCDTHNADNKLALTIGVSDKMTDCQSVSIGTVEERLAWVNEGLELPTCEITDSYGGKYTSLPEKPGTYTLVVTPKDTDGSVYFSKTFTVTCSHQHYDGDEKLVSDYHYSVVDNQIVWYCTKPNCDTHGEDNKLALTITVADAMYGSLSYSIGTEEERLAWENEGIEFPTFEITDSYGNKYSSLPTTPGTYTFVVTPKDADDSIKYSKTFNLLFESTFINDAEGINITYDGKSHNLISEVNATNGVIVYSLSEDGTYTTNIPSATNAGTYCVYYKLQANEGYYGDGEIYHVESKINKVTPIITLEKDSITVKENDLIEYPNATSTFGEVIIDSSNVDITTPGTYKAIYKVLGDDNINSASVELIVIVEAIPAKNCYMHWPLISLLVVAVAAFAVLKFVFKKDFVALLTSCGGIVLAIIFAIFGHCPACVAFAVIDIVAFIGGIVYLLFTTYSEKTFNVLNKIKGVFKRK